MRNRLRIQGAIATIAAGLLALATVSASMAAGPVPGALARAGAVTSAAAVPATCVAGHRACPLRIVFATGAYTAQRSSTLNGIHAVKWFSVKARAGQVMIVLVAGAGPTGGTVYYPNGRFNGQPGGRVFDHSLPLTGTYLIRVTESQMGTAWSGKVTVAVMIY